VTILFAKQTKTLQDPSLVPIPIGTNPQTRAQDSNNIGSDNEFPVTFSNLILNPEHGMREGEQRAKDLS
jgi:hypothetical protein